MIMTATYYFLTAQLLGANPIINMALVSQQLLTNLEDRFVIIAVPLFIFMAHIMNTGKVTEHIFDFANAVVGRRRGGLGHVNVVASIIFSGMTGSAVADASGIGIMEIEAMKKHGYDSGFACAITAASATIGPIFPPSIPMVLYATLSGASIGRLFIAGMIPGLLIGVMLMIYISIIASHKNYPYSVSQTFRELIVITVKAAPALFSVVILLGGIYSGVVTPTEAGALAAAYALLISIFIYRALGIREFLNVIRKTIVSTGIVSIIAGTAFAFGFIVAWEGIPTIIAENILSLTRNPFILLLIINIAFLIMGMFINTATLTVVFVPMVLPLVEALGIDLIHFGVVIVLNMMIGLSTPPFGMLLFIVSGISDTPLKEVIKEILPMLVVLIIVLIMVTYIPSLSLFLVNIVFG
jgi:tripartite ATP-independent transporter DctM subunit